jgi:ferredoxin/flavodoxin---NADP+ reductase
MFKILTKENLNASTAKIIVEAGEIAAKAMAGQFVVLIIDETGERIPLTLAGWDKNKGTITLIFQKVGFSTERLGRLKTGDSIAHILGPLGHPTEVKNVGTVVCIGGGVGIAEMLPVSQAFKAAGNRVIGIIGSRARDLLILEEEMKQVCDELFVVTDDGSAGKRGLVTDILKSLLEASEKSTHTIFPGIVYAIGPVAMMKAVAEMTRGCGIKTIVSLNPIMVDATGMCASCRCTVAGKTAYGCVDGPDFDGHEVDFDELQKRLRTFKDEEGKADAR